jgi:hypothetical protein
MGEYCQNVDIAKTIDLRIFNLLRVRDRNAAGGV